MKKVFIIEDDLNLLNLYRRVLSSNGYEVDTAQEGAIGIEKAKEFEPDIIFLDYILPDMNGSKVLATLRQIPKFKSTPIIMLTGSTDKMRDTFQQGATAYLHKGAYTTKKILDCVKMYAG